ncbi:TIGR00295 family protein [uncultured Methanolobus sp.]|uniref:TIGR00295 family protein n=1 Tax=uncultured Methanolobus sp. TaxID=218300 RepID=UPI0029C78A0B|nr:TIGR00295 family protein [uncultured Methanolobus sp.]
MLFREDALDILKVSGCSDKVIAHCITVAELALEIAVKQINKGKDVDLEIVEIGALLHDLGRARSHGIDHAIMGVEIAKENNIDPSVLEVIKRHIGAGITREEAKIMGLPDDDYIPVTLEQKIVAHADNLVMGTERISLDRRIRKMQEKQIDKKSIERVKALAEEIGLC